MEYTTRILIADESQSQRATLREGLIRAGYRHIEEASNGEEALAFCRIRGCDADGDVSRTRRQRQVINSMINRVKSASVSELNSYLNALLPYVYTDFDKKEILKDLFSPTIFLVGLFLALFSKSLTEY